MAHASLIPDWTQLRPFLPEIWLIGGILASLLIPFFTQSPHRDRAARTSRACGIAAAGSVILGLLALLTSSNDGGAAFGGLLSADPLSRLWCGLLLLFALGIIGIWFAAVEPRTTHTDGPEFFVLLLGAVLGMSLMGSTGNLLMIVIAIELASLPSYVLAGFGKTSRLSAEASLKYVLFGAAATSIMIYGLSILYGLGGSLHFDEIARHLSFNSHSGALALVALLALFGGIAFKISAVPFHFWCPDVFEGARIDITAFLSVASKGAGLVLLLRLLSILAHAADPSPAMTFLAVTIGVIGAATITLGNTAALMQHNIKRLLAYSSIVQAGYMLCALAPLTAGSWTGSFAGNGAATVLMVYLAIYLFMNLGAFAVAALIQHQTGAEDIRQYAGLGRSAPILSACMALFMISLIGLPPLGGFVAKLNVMVLVGSAGGWWWALVGVIAVNTIVSIYYYFNVLRQIYLQSGEQPAFAPLRLGTGLVVTCSIALLAMLVFFAPLNAWTGRHARMEGASVESASANRVAFSQNPHRRTR